MPSTNIDMLQTVAYGLRELKDDMVFIGGAVAELYSTDPAASDIRPTQDVDCIIELSSKTAYPKLEDDLRSKGFINDTLEGAPICRWVFKGIKVDVMPVDPDVLGFSNKWYSEGIENKIAKKLPRGIEVFVFPPEYYLAAKFEAHKGRGGNDLRQSQDFEDIIYILDNCTELLDNIRTANTTIKTYLKGECQNLLQNENITEGIESALPYGSDSDSTEIIQELISSIAEIE